MTRAPVRPAQGRRPRTTAATARWPTRRSAGGSSTRAWPSATTRTRWARPPRTWPSAGACRASARTRSRSRASSARVAAIEAGRFADQIVPIELPQRRATRSSSTATSTRAPNIAGGAGPPAAGLPARRRHASPPATAPASTTARRRCSSPRRAVAGELGLRPMARVVATAVAGVDPAVMGIGPIPATAEGARAGRHHGRRSRPGRAQRGLRLAVAGLHRRARARSGQGQRQWRRDRARPPARDERRPAGHDARPRAAPDGRPLRASRRCASGSARGSPRSSNRSASTRA